MSLKEYRGKRNLGSTPEPAGKTARKSPQARSALGYVIQKHRATQLHYDFRLEFEGVLLSWAVPKGPSLDPSVKRLAMQVEDHPVDYAGFEGVIPEGEYGGGTVMVWDQGVWTPEQDDIRAAIDKGDLKFTLHGAKLQGSWVLVRTRGFGSKADKSWLLIKHRDKFASVNDITACQPRSVVTKRLLAEIARDHGGDVEKAATGDPPGGKPASRRAGEGKGSKAKKAGRVKD
ncbi:MAG TPA: DNA polymerase ligase N-terminal domain-containing protein [Candidatus Saccharimonadales bacterium]|nr:DNA polymerase ligase N-terminal domain-containing protein [Candidatus Saccharimonadales bacterium]